MLKFHLVRRCNQNSRVLKQHSSDLQNRSYSAMRIDLLSLVLSSVDPLLWSKVILAAEVRLIARGVVTCFEPEGLAANKRNKLRVLFTSKPWLVAALNNCSEV